jgi:cell division transport system permease protein
MTLFFLLKEGIAGFKRAPLAATITVVTVAMALTLVGAFGITLQNLSDEFKRTYQQIKLEAFIDPSLDEKQVQVLVNQIGKIAGVGAVQYISSEAALQRYQQETGSDILQILGENPLPPSLQITIARDFSNLNAVKAVAEQIQSFEEVDEVVYAENVLQLLDRYLSIGTTTSIVVGVGIIIIAIVLIFNTIRLTIHSRKNLVEIMQLVGATRRFIKAPFVIEGVLQGVFGGLIACGLLFWATTFISKLSGFAIAVPTVYFAGLIAFGAVLGLTGSYISVSKYLKI